MSDEANTEGKVTLHSIPPGNVPVFNLEVLMSKIPVEGMFRIRIGNLHLESIEKSSTRDAIACIVTDAKKLVKQCVASGQPIPWRDPADQPTNGETRMLVPIHL